MFCEKQRLPKNTSHTHTHTQSRTLRGEKGRSEKKMEEEEVEEEARLPVATATFTCAHSGPPPTSTRCLGNAGAERQKGLENIGDDVAPLRTTRPKISNWFLDKDIQCGVIQQKQQSDNVDVIMQSVAPPPWITMLWNITLAELP